MELKMAQNWLGQQVIQMELQMAQNWLEQLVRQTGPKKKMEHY